MNKDSLDRGNQIQSRLESINNQINHLTKLKDKQNPTNVDYVRFYPDVMEIACLIQMDRLLQEKVSLTSEFSKL